MHFLLAGLLHDDRHRRLEILDAAGDIRIVARAARIAVTVVVHGPDVVTVAGEFVHHRIIGIARHVQIVGRTRRQRRAVHQEQHRPRLLAGLRRADPLAPQIELHVALVRPIFLAPDFNRRGLRRGALRERGRDARGKPGAEAEPGALDDGAACNQVIGHGVLPCGGLDSGLGYRALPIPGHLLQRRIAGRCGVANQRASGRTRAGTRHLLGSHVARRDELSMRTQQIWNAEC